MHAQPSPCKGPNNRTQVTEGGTVPRENDCCVTLCRCRDTPDVSVPLFVYGRVFQPLDCSCGERYQRTSRGDEQGDEVSSRNVSRPSRYTLRAGLAPTSVNHTLTSLALRKHPSAARQSWRHGPPTSKPFFGATRCHAPCSVCGLRGLRCSVRAPRNHLCPTHADHDAPPYRRTAVPPRRRRTRVTHECE